MFTRFFSQVPWVLSVLLLVMLPQSTIAAEFRWNPSVAPVPAKNLLPNSSFELGTDGWSSVGRNTASGGDLCGLYGMLEAGNAVDGDYSLRIDLGPEITPVTHSGYTLGASQTVVQAAPLLANLGWIEVKTGTHYTLSAYLRADRSNVKAKLLFRFGGGINTGYGANTYAKEVTLTEDWARYSYTMEAYLPDLYVAVGPDLRATPEAEATVWIDAVQLEEATGASAEAVPTDYEPREAVEIGLNTERYGNVFDAADAIELKVYGANTTETAASILLEARLEDYFGVDGAASSVTLNIPANETANTTLPLDTPGPGYYRARVRWEANGNFHDRELKFAVIQTYAWDDSPFGINHGPSSASANKQLHKGGTTWVRDWSMKWDEVEKVEGTYDFSEIDRQVARAADEGMNFLPILPPQPSTQWASEAPEDVVPIERAGYAPKPEDRPKLYAYIGATIERYKDRNPYWEFLNEPLWVPWYCLPTSAGYSVDTYIELLQGASAAMKAADPDCIVIGGLSITAESTLGDEFIQKGGLEYVDIYNLHPYPTPNQAPERFIRNMQRVLGVMDAQGERIPIWATELGYWATDDKPWRPWTPPNDSHWSANRQQASEREASDYNIRHAVILLAHNVDKIFWHSGTSGELNNGSYDLENPLLDPEAIPQKFYAAQAALAHLLGPMPILDAEFEKPETVDGVSTEGVHGYAFEGSDSSVLVVWAPGQYNTGQRGAGRIVRLGESPVYLTSATMNATQLASACALVRIPPAASGAYIFNGWGAVLSADASVAFPSPFGELTMHTAKATDGTSEVRWETQVAPVDITGGNHIFKWLGATGYDSEPEGTFALYLGETKLLDFEVALTSTTWTSDDGAFRLDYRPFKTFNEGEDSAGVMTLTVPASMLTPGEKAQLRVVGGDSESQRWFGIYESADGAMSAPSWALELPEGVNAYSVVGTPLLEEEQTALASLVGSE